MLLLQTVYLAMPNSWPERTTSVEKGVMSVGYSFSSASSLVMRVRQVVFASAPAFCKLGSCVPDRMGPAEPAAMAGADQIHNQHMCARPEIIAKTPPSMSYARV